MTISRRKILGTSLAVPFLSAFGAAGGTASTAKKFAPPPSGRELMRRRYFPDVPLTTHTGKRVLFYSDLLKDKIVVLNLMYTKCTAACPTITSHLVQAQKVWQQKIKGPIFIYSITIKPEEDTSAKLAEYARMHHVGKDWLFLTGRPDDIELLRHTLGYVDLDPQVDKDKSRHSGILRYGNEPLALWGACEGNAEPSWIAEEISFVVPHRSLA
jgi:protein SCO1/2